MPKGKLHEGAGLCRGHGWAQIEIRTSGLTGPEDPQADPGHEATAPRPFLTGRSALES